MPIAGQDFRCSFGVCQPLNSATLSVFKDLQTLINRALVKQGVNMRVDVDGEIGAQTVTGAKAAYDAGFPVDYSSSPDQLAANAGAYVLAYEKHLGSNPITAAWEWMQSFFNKPAPKPAPAPGAPPAVAIPGAGGGLMSNTTLLLAGGGLLAYALMKRKKRKGRRR